MTITVRCNNAHAHTHTHTHNCTHTHAHTHTHTHTHNCTLTHAHTHTRYHTHMRSVISRAGPCSLFIAVCAPVVVFVRRRRGLVAVRVCAAGLRRVPGIPQPEPLPPGRHLLHVHCRAHGGRHRLRFRFRLCVRERREAGEVDGERRGRRYT